MTVVDRWHKSRPADGEPTCTEHDRVPTSVHGTGDRWAVRWRDEAGRQRTKNFATKAPAEVFDTKQRSDVHHGTSVDIVAARMKVSAYFDRWAAGLLVRQSTANLYRSMFRNHVAPVIGDLAIGQVRASHIRTVLKRASGTLGATSLAMLRTGLATMFKAAVGDRIIGASPVDGVKVPTPARQPVVIATVDQVHAVAGHLGRYSAASYLAAGCGLRLGEILGLETDAVNFLRRTVSVRQQLVNPNRGKSFIGPPKTETSVRTVELPAIVAAALSEHMRNHPPAIVEIADRTDPRDEVERAATLLFTTPHGRPVHRRAWWDAWTVARDRAGLPEGSGIHALRHLYASSLIAGGASVKQVQAALGHSRPSVTLDVYTHLWPDTEGHARRIVDGVLGAAPATKIKASVRS